MGAQTLHLCFLALVMRGLLIWGGGVGAQSMCPPFCLFATHIQTIKHIQTQLEQIKMQAETGREKEIEDRKDKRTRIAGTQQSAMIDQRKNDSSPKDFESAGNDNMSGFDMGQFGPM